MSEVPREIFNQLITIINPLMGNLDDRKAIVRLGVYDRTFIQKLNFSGNALTFTTNFLYELIDYDLRLVLQLIETLIQHYVGSNDQQALRHLHQAISQFLDPKHTPPDGGMRILLIDKNKLDNHSQADINRLIQTKFPENSEIYILDFFDSDFIMIIVVFSKNSIKPALPDYLTHHLRIDHTLGDQFRIKRKLHYRNHNMDADQIITPVYIHNKPKDLDLCVQTSHSKPNREHIRLDCDGDQLFNSENYDHFAYIEDLGSNWLH